MDNGQARRAIAANTHRFAELVRAAPDPEQRVAGSEWCVREVAAHLVVIPESFERYLTGDMTPVIDVTDLATTNPVAISAVQERDVATLTNRIEAATDRFLELTKDRDLGDGMWWHGVETTVGAVYGIYLGELLMHGYDVARTIRKPWPIDAATANVVYEGTLQIVHLFVDRERPQPDSSFELRVRRGPSFVLRFAGGDLSVQPGRARDVGCRVSADPVALLLVLYKRQSQWGAIARGQLVASGRRPWLAFGLKDRFGGF